MIVVGGGKLNEDQDKIESAYGYIESHQVVCANTTQLQYLNLSK